MASEPLQESELQTTVLESSAGLRLEVLNLGAAVRALTIPLAGNRRNVVLGYANLRDYINDEYFVGVTVGPFANRIAAASFELDGREFLLDANETTTSHSLHAGELGLHRRIFDVVESAAGGSVLCRLHVADQVDGFPGNRVFEINYEWLDGWSLAIDFIVSTDRDTVVNLANHCYFNLGGDLAAHQLRVLADDYTPLDTTGIPTGDVQSVAQTKYDLRDWRRLGSESYDDNYVLRDGPDEGRVAAQLRSGLGDLQLDLATTQPGLQVYTGDSLGDPFAARAGLCLEAQRFPDTPNQPAFGSARLAAGDRYRQRSVLTFSFLSV
ncbi:MAG: aldose epimerase family protein [Woeseiaceae bacterium]